ncbi:unnamed protein product [Prorocentrum cordatum]|uniref:Uncharacterized protein n=1 Tax=Prorocentrum cordatum TaxID=2364126 RepID=A0ABN9UAA2_9DINO|nr:unnamed protein product [Polarella glacialis]
MCRGILAPLFLDLALLMLRGEAAPPGDFNLAYLICLPKSAGTSTSTGGEFYDAGSTHPLSIVDASNRILASIFRVVPVLAKLFAEFESIYRLALNVKRTGFIPLWKHSSERGLRNLITELAPSWRDIIIATQGMYLGFWIGPGACSKSWSKPLENFHKRVLLWSKHNLGLNLSAIAFNLFICSVLSYVMQLQELPADFADTVAWALRRLVPGPGNWATAADLCYLKEEFGFPCSFTNPADRAQAAKLRVVETVAPDCKDRCAELSSLGDAVLQGPFGRWHQNSFFAILARAEEKLGRSGMTRAAVRRAVAAAPPEQKSLKFQAVAVSLIRAKSGDRDQRLQHKISRWSFPGAGVLFSVGARELSGGAEASCVRQISQREMRVHGQDTHTRAN